jgi:hypothetical protein
VRWRGGEGLGDIVDFCVGAFEVLGEGVGVGSSWLDSVGLGQEAGRLTTYKYGNTTCTCAARCALTLTFRHELRGFF